MVIVNQKNRPWWPSGVRPPRWSCRCRRHPAWPCSCRACGCGAACPIRRRQPPKGLAPALASRRRPPRRADSAYPAGCAPTNCPARRPLRRRCPPPLEHGRSEEKSTLVSTVDRRATSWPNFTVKNGKTKANNKQSVIHLGLISTGENPQKSQQIAIHVQLYSSFG